MECMTCGCSVSNSLSLSLFFSPFSHFFCLSLHVCLLTPPRAHTHTHHPFRFRSKYHPDELGKRKADAHAALQNRLGSFQYLMENGWFESISMDIDRAPQILKILDAGGTRLCVPVTLPKTSPFTNNCFHFFYTHKLVFPLRAVSFLSKIK